jgi:hypothetical protein
MARRDSPLPGEACQQLPVAEVAGVRGEEVVEGCEEFGWPGACPPG